jgi:hypothetical protein
VKPDVFMKGDGEEEKASSSLKSASGKVTCDKDTPSLWQASRVREGFPGGAFQLLRFGTSARGEMPQPHSSHHAAVARQAGAFLDADVEKQAGKHVDAAVEDQDLFGPGAVAQALLVGIAGAFAEDLPDGQPESPAVETLRAVIGARAAEMAPEGPDPDQNR